MYKPLGSILFVGSVPGDSATDVMRLCGEETGNYVSSLSDGETGNRSQWVQFLASNVYNGHPSIETIQRPQPKDGTERWHNEDYKEDGWLFRIKDGIADIHLPELGYAREAKKSYLEFCELRRGGAIPAGVRFQVSLPLTESAVRIFVTNPHDFELMKTAFEVAMKREIDLMLEAIPANDLVIQWDMALEVLFIVLDGKTPWAPAGDIFERVMESLGTLSGRIPADTLIGCHFCYGDLGHKHLLEPTDLSLAVRLANAACLAVSRPINYFHLPVPRNRTDDEYFSPLRHLHIGDAKLYLGLIHHSDGVEGSLKRMHVAQKYVSGFGVATECGMGRRHKDTIPALLHIHREVANKLQ